eukprot:5913566-Amphidinium_carterae.1
MHIEEYNTTPCPKAQVAGASFRRAENVLRPWFPPGWVSLKVFLISRKDNAVDLGHKPQCSSGSECNQVVLNKCLQRTHDPLKKEALTPLRPDVQFSVFRSSSPIWWGSLF